MIKLTKAQSQLWIDTLQAIKNEESRFSMPSFFESDYVDDCQGESYSCGTAACFVGHADLISRKAHEKFFTKRKTDWFDKIEDIDELRIARKLGLPYEPAGNNGIYERLIVTSNWCPAAEDLYDAGRVYRGALTQVKHLFKKYEIKLHKSFCELEDVRKRTKQRRRTKARRR